ncbi:MAG TPA: hypothetical protein VFW09_12325 [Solirubrobacteraceae bacterium]|jgi:hypothetical protein|nr:hypothetical protein [Solirubrobacteraceae bacterium]
MTARAKQQLVSIVPKGTGSTCRSVIGTISKLITGAQVRQVRDAKIVDVRVHGDTATARILGATTARLTKTGGHWLISGGFQAP